MSSLNSPSSASLYLIVGPVCSSCGVSKTDFVNSGSYLRTVFVFISGMTTFTGLAGGAAGFFTSCLIDTEGGEVTMAFLASGAATGLVVAAVVAGAGCGLDAGLDILDTIVFFMGPNGFFAGAVGATFFTTG